jgi:hypothetical protein
VLGAAALCALDLNRLGLELDWANAKVVALATTNPTATTDFKNVKKLIHP